MTADDLVRSWCLTLRDLCDSGAESASVRLEGGLTITYADGAATVRGGGAVSVLPDDALDDHGLVPA